MSRGFTGKATALYQNGEWYEGEYIEGVSNQSINQSINQLIN